MDLQQIFKSIKRLHDNECENDSALQEIHADERYPSLLIKVCAQFALRLQTGTGKRTINGGWRNELT